MMQRQPREVWILGYEEKKQRHRKIDRKKKERVRNNEGEIVLVYETVR